MTDINCLTRTDAINAGDLLPIWQNGGTYAASFTTLIAFVQAQIAGGLGFITQYAAPSATNFNVLIAPVTPGTSTYLLLTPVSGYAAGSITLPQQPLDMQEVLVSTTQAITALTIAGNGFTVIGAPTTLAQFGFFRLRFDGVLKTWNRVG